MSTLPDKLKHYEVVPPAHTWEKIAAELDASLSGQELPSKLYHMQVAPPASAWSNIDAALHTPVVALPKRKNSFLRYAAAAVFIGIAAFGIIKWTSGSSDTGNDTASVKTKNAGGVEKKTAAPSIENSNPGKSVPQIIPDDNAETALAAGNPAKVTRKRVPVTATYNDAIDEQATNPLYAYEDHSPRIADRYIMLMTPEGNFIRMSKKWSDLVCCVSGEEQDADCKSQLKKWQEKLASSPAATSPGNFLDILNLVNSLDDNGTEL